VHQYFGIPQYFFGFKYFLNRFAGIGSLALIPLFQVVVRVGFLNELFVGHEEFDRSQKQQAATNNAIDLPQYRCVQGGFLGSGGGGTPELSEFRRLYNTVMIFSF